jgi:hypothetical protein
VVSKGRPPPAQRGRLSESERTRIEGRFGLVLALLFIATFLSIATPQRAWTLLLTSLVLATTLGIAMLVSGVSKRAVRAWLSVAVAGLGLSMLIALTQEPRVAGGYLAITSLIFTGATIGAIARRILQHTEISVLTVLGALCIYVLVGFSFAFAYEVVGSFSSQPFFVSQQAGTRSDYVYFSFVTMATVGYGDLAAQASLGRALAVTEGLLGQIYLVTAVAALVGNVGHAHAGNVGHARAPRQGSGEETQGDNEQ